MIKLFAFDLDGTVLNSRSIIDKETIDAFKKLDENGIKFVFATGRVTTSVAYFMEKTGVDNPLVANNGAAIFLNKDTLLKESYIDTDILKMLRDFAKTRGLYYHFYDLNTYYSEYLVNARLKHLEKEEDTGYGYQVNISISEDPIEQLSINNSKAFKFQIFADEEKGFNKDDMIRELVDEFGEDLYVTSSGEYFIEIMAKNVSKWQAIMEIAQTLGIKKSEIAAIGDQDNDYPMIANAGLSFAMGNAIDSIKEVADYRVSNNDDYGVVEAIEKVLELNKNV
ncbi:MAG: Cof-type HAD-IIB family hydrolase [Anaerococcus sp.]|nr:Cof-type HAD-IIB family hydrolase [Peptoniphilaceae bacterium]MDY3055910.1 Cof-type HAD-IIB family hydrolase [Anaerococcus sp.]